jgi:hypothetical protein
MSWNPTERVALIDGDLLVYAASWIGQEERTCKKALISVRDMLVSIKETLHLHDYKIFLSGKGGFRKLLSASYKANRKDQPIPVYFHKVREYLRRRFGAVEVEGEADDAIADAHTLETVIVSVDKDFRQLPGWIYNYRKYTLTHITRQEAEYNFWTQMLEGDKADNIKGVPGIGPVKAKRILDGTNSLYYYDAVLREYRDRGIEADFEINKKLLTIGSIPNG